LEELANVFALNGSYRSARDKVDGDRMGMEERNEIEPALDFSNHGPGRDEMLDLDDKDKGVMYSEDEPGILDDKVMEDIVELPSDVRLLPLHVHNDGSFFPSSELPDMRVGIIASFSSTVNARDPSARV
jgi:hypothetical protein